MAEYIEEAGWADFPERDEMNTRCPRPRGQHRRGQRTRQGDRGTQVDVEYAVDLLLGQGAQQAGGGMGRVGDQHIHLSLQRLAGEAIDIRGDGEVGHDRARAEVLGQL